MARGDNMNLNGIKIGFCICGSFCTFDQIIPQIRKLIEEGADIFPIFSDAVYAMDTRFYSAQEFRDIVEGMTGKKVIHTIIGAEPIGPRRLMDIVVVAPCTGNTLARLANGITDTSVTMACKAHLRNQKPVILGISTNDGLGANAKNLGLLLNNSNIFFVPFGQDDPNNKANSLVADFDQIVPTVIEALKGRQIQPVLI